MENRERVTNIRFQVIKVGIEVIINIIILLCLLSSCTWNTVTTQNSSYNCSRLNSVIVNNDFLYYSVQSPEDLPNNNLTYSLYQCKNARKKGDR